MDDIYGEDQTDVYNLISDENYEPDTKFTGKHTCVYIYLLKHKSNFIMRERLDFTRHVIQAG